MSSPGDVRPPINLINEPCDCPKGQCAQFVEDDEHCINRRTGDVRTLPCGVCKATTWHQDGHCIRCETRPW